IRDAPQNVSVVGRSVWLGDSHRLLINVGDGRISLMDSLSKKTREVLSILPEMIRNGAQTSRTPRCQIQNTGMPVAMIPNTSRAMRSASKALTRSKIAAARNTAGVTGYPGTLYGRCRPGLLRRSTYTAATPPA